MTQAPETDKAQRHLKAGAIGIGSIVFLVIATAGPLAGLAGGMPIAVGYGNGLGTPGAYLIAGLLLALFAVGYAAMSRRITNAGAFYAYISAGLGRTWGLIAGYLAVFCYNILTVYVVALAAVFATGTLGPVLPFDVGWQVYALVFIVAAWLLGMLGVDLNAKLLALGLIVETGLIFLIVIGTIATFGLGAFTLRVFSPSEVFGNPAPGIALLFAFLCFIGFEGTAIFSEEAKDPRRTVSRATFIAVGITTVVYVVASWSIIVANGTDKAQAAAAASPGTFLQTAAEVSLGSWASHAVDWLLLSSITVVMLAIHNMAARYMFAFGRERLLPRALGETHPTFETPHIAGAVQAGFNVIVVLIYWLTGADPYINLASQSGALGTLGLLILEFGVCVAVVAYFRNSDESLAVRLICPGLAMLGLGGVIYLTVSNYDLLSGTKSFWVTYSPVLFAIPLIAGLVMGVRRRTDTPVNLYG